MPPQGRPGRDTHALRHPSGTAPFDAYASTPQPLEAVGAEGSVRREALAQVIQEAEPLLALVAPRLGAIARADAANAPNRPSFDVLFEGASEGERAFTLQLARVLSERPEATRLARIALQQFRQAEEDLALAQAAHAQFVEAGLEVGAITGFSVAKFRGALYPLYNLSVTFEGIPLLESLFPRSRAGMATRPLMAAGGTAKTQDLAPPPAAPPERTPLQRFGDWLVMVLGGSPPPEH